jgi:hypothetical protein
MSESKEPMVFINWQEVGRRWSRLGFALVAGLCYLAVLALIFEAAHIALYVAHLPGAGGRWSRVHVVSLVGLEAAAAWFLTLVRKQWRAREWSGLLTVFVLSMMSYVTFRCSEPVAVTQAKTTAAVGCGDMQMSTAVKPATLKKR